MLERNRIYCIDVLEGLKQLDDESVDLIITSPPYNKNGFNKLKHATKRVWNQTIAYDGDEMNDYMPEDEYEKWQIEVLNECFRVLKKDGSMFYNHKERFHQNVCSFPLEWINKSKFIFRQLIVWDRGAAPNFDGVRYLPTTEYFFWLIKEKKNPRFRRQKNTEFKTNVWRIIPDKNTEHPAPFPIKIPDNIIPCVAQGERILVLDPFMGSGTVAISAKKNGCDYIGFEKSKLYTEMAEKNLANFS